MDVKPVKSIILSGHKFLQKMKKRRKNSMNRKERRDMAKKIAHNSGRRENGANKRSFKSAFVDVSETYKLREFEEGDTVLLSQSWIKSQPDYKFQPKEFWEWLEKNNNGVFHVQYDKSLIEQGNPDYKKFVCLEEDETNPKWVLRSDALIPVKVNLNAENNENENKDNVEVENGTSNN